MSELRVAGLVRRFGATAAVDGVSFALAAGETLALVGPSGSGKSTTLRCIAGFETPDAGRITCAGEDVTGLLPARRRFGMVFQSYALFPHLDVAANVGFGLEAQGVRGAALRRQVDEALVRVDLAGLGARRIHELSGGQQQRVALARALAPAPRVLLLDEPLSNLDPSLRERTRRELAQLLGRLGVTTVIVTHDQDEAFALGRRVAVLRDGRLEQVGTPEELYEAPRTPFVAGFVGRASTLAATVTGLDIDRWRVRVGPADWAVPTTAATVAGPGPCRLLVRPEAVRLGASASDALGGTVVGRRFVGAGALLAVETPAGVVELLAPTAGARVGDHVSVLPSRRGPGGLLLFPAEGA